MRRPPCPRRAASSVARIFGRVVRVVVDDERAAERAEELEAALDAGEALEARGDRLERQVELEGDGDRGERVAHVVLPGDLQGDLADPLARADDGETARAPLEAHDPLPGASASGPRP